MCGNWSRVINRAGANALDEPLALRDIPHLADKVMVLEAGKVKAFGSLEYIWGSRALKSALRIRIQATDMSLVL